MISVAQIGCGYWGPNLLRNVHNNPLCHIKWVVECSIERQKYVQSHYPDTAVTEEFEEAIADPEVEAVVIATPAASHFEMAKAALNANKHVLVEKPLTLTVQEAEELVELAFGKGKVLMAGHTYIYNKYIDYIHDKIDKGDLGDLHYIQMERLNLGKARTDVNAWLNLAPHDVSILLYLMDGQLPIGVSATGIDCTLKGVEDVVVARLEWADGMTAYIHVSWLNPQKVRTVNLVGSKKMMVFDDLKVDKITIYDKGIDLMPLEEARMDYDDFRGVQLIHRVGAEKEPKIDMPEPLAEEIAHFVQCISNGIICKTGAVHGRDVVAVLAAGQESIKCGGKTMKPTPYSGNLI